VIGEARSLTDCGGQQNAQFNVRAIKVASLDSVLDIEGEANPSLALP
jgi:hypothetical protein